MERAPDSSTSLEGILDCNGAYFSQRGAVERAAFSFEDYMLSTTKSHVMGRETLRRHVLNPRDMPK